jgi:hypothetical protein
LLVQRWKIWLAAGGMALVLADAALATTLAAPSASRDAADDEDAPWQEAVTVGAVSVPLGEVGSGADGGNVFPPVAPGPTTLALVSLGLVGLTLAGRRRDTDDEPR